jgi:hypothetical protein
VAGEAVGENSGCKIKLVVFVGGTCGSVHVQTLNNNLKELGVIESKRNTIRRGLVHELLNAQDTVLCSYFAQRSGARGEGRSRESTVGEVFQGLDHFERDLTGSRRTEMGRKTTSGTHKYVDGGMWEQEGKSRVWQPWTCRDRSCWCNMLRFVLQN